MTIWTQKLRDAAHALATSSNESISRDLRSRAAEMRSMPVGATLTEAQEEFVTCMRQRFGFKPAAEETAFETAWQHATKS